MAESCQIGHELIVGHAVGNGGSAILYEVGEIWPIDFASI